MLPSSRCRWASNTVAYAVSMIIRTAIPVGLAVDDAQLVTSPVGGDRLTPRASIRNLHDAFRRLRGLVSCGEDAAGELYALTTDTGGPKDGAVYALVRG
jgi:hypothetical protein